MISHKPLLYSRSLDARQFYFTQLVVLDTILNLLREDGTSPTHSSTFITAVHALSFIMKVALSNRRSEIVTHCQTKPTVMSGEHGCTLNNFCSDDPNCVCFQVQNETIYGKKSVLVAKSEIFAAMLKGDFAESELCEIPVRSNSPLAFKCVLHDIHGCTVETCTVLQHMYRTPVNTDTVAEVIEVINEAEKNMLSDLKLRAKECLCHRYIVPETAFQVFKLASLHRWPMVLKKCVSCLLADKNQDNIVCNVSRVMCSPYADLFCNVVCEVLTE